MRDSTALPDLRMLPTSTLIPHEDYDPRRVEKLCQRVIEEDRLKHPPVIAAIPGTERFVILDGANRVMAFARLEVPHIVAQLVSYGDPGVILDTWYHVVAGMPLAEFESALKQVAGLTFQPSSLEEARAARATDNAAAYIVSENGVRIAQNPEGRPRRDIQLLNGIVDAYKGRADIYRASNDSWEKQKPYYPAITALVVFPQLSPSDILMAARNGDKVPGGITRHIIPNRAVNINIPLSVLNAYWSLQRKEEWLRDWMMERMSANAIRFYSESTFSFDE